ncbi:YunC family protein [Pseudomonadales bacterium]|jgi:uncharacterized protein YunC (DUF1805 family)|nr:YunC family protein [Gammaproteobacteria bacterium]MDA7726053.1 YunC family protein [Pseudomonadales bacterium]MBT3735826.1 YunC family protein [Gammaproteobacteria bacterium]MBT3899217.1 YunC family protein [Gammaproteobacteria bacterium]MBT7538325.1 YunC family protein [Gammaproteobacteria bacterium]|tara:strand:+ start:7471 stop:7803 length:333 start_codon:yes stop_codon:yes gene_type:complete
MKPILLSCLIAIFLTFHPLVSAEMDWQGLDRERIELALPLLVIKGSKGLLACGYVNVKTCNKTKEACAIVSGVMNHNEMLVAKVNAVSPPAQALGVTVGMTGAEALERFR